MSRPLAGGTSQRHIKRRSRRAVEVDAGRDAEAAAFAATARRDHREELQSQIAFNAERRARERREYEEEGDRLRAALAQERAKLEAIKQRKLDELEDGGIPAKYRAELAKKKIGA